MAASPVTLTLLPHAAKVARDNAIPAYHASKQLLYHQQRTYEAMEHAPLVMNTYPTGTGKTAAALLRLLHPRQQRSNTLFIAPTNALIDQHTQDIETFLHDNHLDMQVIKANAETLRPLAPHLRAGEVTQQILYNPTTFAEQLGLPADRKRPFVLVTNPDIFYLALFFQYGRLDQRNIFAAFISQFRYVVIDEFHYYDNKQFANFLFFFRLWKQWGYFETNTICLLSATPRQQVYTYLNRVFGADTWVRVGPDNEPPESADLQTKPTLTELRMTVVEGEVDTWVRDHYDEVAGWSAAGLDSAIISSTLWRVNIIHETLRALDPVRITGPASSDERRRISPLVLATPTVDIGYNFGRPGKQRQSIDRLVCDARYGDEITQRIGRVGRVLGRAETTQPSEAVVVLSEEAVHELRDYDGHSLSRGEWAEVVAGLQHLPPKHQLDDYITMYALRESFYPIFHLNKLSPTENKDHKDHDDLFEAMREVFAPHSKLKAKDLWASFQIYEKRRSWLKKSESERWSLHNEWNRRELAQHVADYLDWLRSCKGATVSYTAARVAPQLDDIVRRMSAPAQKKDLEAFVESQVALTKAMFAFREAWQGPKAAVYDPRQLLSNEVVNTYDALHLVANYEYTLFQGSKEFRSACGLPGDDNDCKVYMELRDFRTPRLALNFAYSVTWERTTFEERCCRRVTTLRGLRLSGREHGGGDVMLDPRVCSLVEQDWIPCLVVEQERAGPLISKLRGSSWYAREVRVIFENGSSHEYRVVMGTAALHIDAALRGYFKKTDRADDCIIL